MKKVPEIDSETFFHSDRFNTTYIRIPIHQHTSLIPDRQ